MIESLADHGVQAMDLVPALMTTHTVANPEYDPQEARRTAELHTQELDAESIPGQTLFDSSPPASPTKSTNATSPDTTPQPSFQTTAKVLNDTSTTTIAGVTTSLSSSDENVTLDIRWTVLCDLFLILIADSVYDARSRVLLENVALKLGLGWLDVVKFESRVTEALEIQEDVEKMEHQELIEGRQKAARKKRYVMMGLATLGAFFLHLIARSPGDTAFDPRRWSSDRSICGIARPSDRCRARCSIHHHRNHWHDWVSCGSRRRGCYYDGWCADGVQYRGPGNGQTYSTSPNIRYLTPP